MNVLQPRKYRYFDSDFALSRRDASIPYGIGSSCKSDCFMAENRWEAVKKMAVRMKPSNSLGLLSWLMPSHYPKCYSTAVHDIVIKHRFP
jgi:hypothetical protein